MSSERGRVISIFAAVALVAGGGGYYFFEIYRPDQVRRDARDEIAAWETRWTAARSCLLGATPGSPKTSEALAIREMTPDPWDRGSCTPLISKLSRGEAPDTGLPGVETAWAELEHAASKAALAFATHVGSSTTLKQDPLPAALDALDRARGELRTAADLPAAVQAGTPLPAATLVPLRDGADPVTEMAVDGVPSAHGFIAFGKTANHLVQISLFTGAAPKIGRLGPGSLRSMPDPAFGATLGTDDLVAGALDPEGVVQAPAHAKVPGIEAILSVLGTSAGGEIVVRSAGSLVIVKSKGSAIIPDPAIAIDSGGAVTDVDGRAIVAWTKVANLIAGMHAQILRPGADEPVVDLPSPATANPCLSASRAWVLGLGEVMSFGGGKPLAEHEIVSTILLGCTLEGALLRDRDPRKPFEICVDATDACRIAKLPAGAPEFSAATIVGGKLVAIASHGGVLGVWREDRAPVFYALPELADPVLAHEWAAMALTDGKVIDVIARGAKTFVIIRLPAS